MRYGLVQSQWVKKATPIILTVAASAGVAGTAVLAAKATPEALHKKEEAEAIKGEPLTNWEKFKAMAPSYIPAAGAGLATLGAIGGLVLDSNRKQAELASIVAGGNQIINRISRKYSVLRDKVEEKQPDIVKELDEKTFDDQWNEYVKNRNNKKKAWSFSKCLPDCSGEEWGIPRMFGIEYGNGLVDENGHEMIFFEATPGDVITAFYNLNGIFHSNSNFGGLIYVNQLFHLLNLPKTELGERLVWDISVMVDEWETDWISFFTEDIAMEDDVPQPAVCTMIYFNIPPLAEGYAEGIGTPDYICPAEPSNLQTV